MILFLKLVLKTLGHIKQILFFKKIKSTLKKRLKSKKKNEHIKNHKQLNNQLRYSKNKKLVFFLYFIKNKFVEFFF